MSTKTNLTKAVRYLSTGMVITAASISNVSASSTNYNTYNSYSSNIVSDGQGGTDGWTNRETSGWTNHSAPFGTTTPVANWAAEITSAGDALTISSQDAYDRYQVWADIDTAKGGWSDGTTGWGHNTDVGLFRSAVDTNVTLNISALQLPGSSETWSNFGISVFSGMSANTWDHHGVWNCLGCNAFPGFTLPPIPYESDNPLGSTGLTYVTHGETVNAIDSLSFHASAGQVYSILLGGNSGGTNYTPHAGYSMSITTSPVPIPAAAWLFGGALLSLFGVKRQKSILPA